MIQHDDYSSLVELLELRAKTQSDEVLYTFLQQGIKEVNTLTYGELAQQAKKIASYLQSLNLAGERALLVYPPGVEFITAFFGCLYAGVIAVPAYPPRRNQRMARLKSIVENATTAICLTTSETLTRIENQLSDEPSLSAIEWLVTNDIETKLADAWNEPEISSNNLAFLQYTSGSTGTPKGVMVSHRNILHNLSLIKNSFGHHTNSRGVIWLPPYHDMGLIGGILQPMYAGFPVMLMSPLDFLQKPYRWLQAISHYRATTSGGPNFAYDLVCRKIKPEQIETLDLSSWEVAFTGAEPVRSETIQNFVETFAPCGFRAEAFYPCYGMAETTLIVTGGAKTVAPIIDNFKLEALKQKRHVRAKPRDSETQILVGCGQSVSGADILIVDPDNCTLCQEDQIGEIWISSTNPSVAHGYWQLPEETEKIFNAYLADTEAGPFLRTGDLGFFENGELFIAGRIKDSIIIRGQNYYPQDIEVTVVRSHPILRPDSGAAFSIEVKNAERLVIVQEVEREKLQNVDYKEVINNIIENIASEHDLQVYAVVLVNPGSIPKTSSGKIQRHRCKSSFLDGTLNFVEDWSENPGNRIKFLQIQQETESILKNLLTKPNNKEE
ncbi:fatty acyl-AMP ligase [Gloeocapsa sp. PCC 73106]|uniref:fatty acyl-AMP ligase n=1 Tax=Gloeocapsa sp. PCC 73106 TaxID=102232 RepID=UPI0002AC3090|nr:fatty acyl-AMP ligase [Gloeocapsa sp. PCC 73106]ELR99059.1 acyl-CoA synthetase (AMP-forming)/AMP-acid ligase II [Gloeocapsa sp. PCC 73106]